MKTTSVPVCTGVVGQQKRNKAVFHLGIRIPKGIETKFRIIILNRQITALLDHRYGAVWIRPVVRKTVGRKLNPFKLP